MALAISPKLKIEVYEWLFDALLRHRNDSGNSYKKMCGPLWANASNKREFQAEITDIASQIKKECNVNNWQEASEDQLKLRDRMHENIYLLASKMKNNHEAVRLGIIYAKKGEIK